MSNKLKIFFFLIIFAKISFAQGPPIFTDTPVFLGLDGRGVRTFIKYVSTNNANVQILPIAVPVNIGANAEVGAVIPFVRKSVDGVENKTGLSDISLFFKQLLFRIDKRAKTFRITAKVIQDFPTGNSESIPALGTGKYQTNVGLVSGYVTTEYGMYTELIYNILRNGLPKNLIYNFAFSYPLLPQTYPLHQLNLSLGVNGITLFSDKNNTVLFLSPGIQFIPANSYLLELGFQFPIVDELPKPKKTKFNILLGTRVLLY